MKIYLEPWDSFCIAGRRTPENSNEHGEEVVVPRGRPFAKGNGGRKLGSRNKTTQIAAALVEGEAKALVRKAKELVLAGDVTMLKFLLGRILPRERLIIIDLPHEIPSRRLWAS